MKNIVIAACLFAACLVLAPHAQAELKTQTLEHKQGDVVQKSYLAFDLAAPKPIGSEGDRRPAVLVVPEWWGLNAYARYRADELAKLGYVALAVDVYGNGDASADSKDAGRWASKYKTDRLLLRERLNSALAALKARPEVAPGKIAVIGYCFGGMSAIEMARAGSDVACAVSFHGSLDASDKAPTVETITAKILVLHGAADPYEPAAQIDAFQKEMNEHKADWQMNYYAYAKHGFTNGNNAGSKMDGVNYNEKADQRSWRAMRDFFDETFAPAKAAK